MGFGVARPFLPYRRPETIAPCGELGKVCRGAGFASALIVTDRSFAGESVARQHHDEQAEADADRIGK